MTTDTEILARIDQAFATSERPERFHHHPCDECIEHDALLQSRDRTTLTHDDVGSQAWDPMAGVSPAGFAYYLPALARLALGPEHETWGWYGEQLLFHLRLDGPHNERWTHCTPEQRAAVVALIEHLCASRSDIVTRYDIDPMLHEALAAWQ